MEEKELVKNYRIIERFKLIYNDNDSNIFKITTKEAALIVRYLHGKLLIMNGSIMLEQENDATLFLSPSEIVTFARRNGERLAEEFPQNIKHRQNLEQLRKIENYNSPCTDTYHPIKLNITPILFMFTAFAFTFACLMLFAHGFRKGEEKGRDEVLALFEISQSAYWEKKWDKSLEFFYELQLENEIEKAEE